MLRSDKDLERITEVEGQRLVLERSPAGPGRSSEPLLWAMQEEGWLVLRVLWWQVRAWLRPVVWKPVQPRALVWS